MGVTVPDIAKVEIAIVEMTNAFRRENKLAEVRTNPKLNEVARAYASYLALSGKFSHTADGRSVSDRMQAGGYVFCQAAENLSLNRDSRGFETERLASDAVELWKRSAGHRKNLLAEQMTEIGVGVARARDKEQYLSVQVFGRPDGLRYAFVIRNRSGAVVRYAVDEATLEVKPGFEVRHTACTPGKLKFVEARSGIVGRLLESRFETKDGDVFTVHGNAAADVSVEVGRVDAVGPAQASVRAR